MTESAKDQINLHLGWPNPSLLPAKLLKKAADEVLTDPQFAVKSLSYGPDAGNQSLREELARWLSSHYSSTCELNLSVPFTEILPDEICVTGGASQSLASILQTFTDPLHTQNIWMVSPTYYLACRIFDDAGFAGKLRSVPEDDEGLDIDFLTRQLDLSTAAGTAGRNEQQPLKPSRPWRKLYRHVIYAVPTFANPSGKVMSYSRRQALVRLARYHDALIITDDVYDFLVWPKSEADSLRPSAAIMPRIVDIDRQLDGGPVDPFGNAASNGSFSKILGPGCRTGWVQGTDQFAYGLSQCGSSRSGGCASQLVASCIPGFLANGALQSHINKTLLPAYSQRYYAAMTAIRENLVPLGVTTNPPHPNFAGGYFIWLKLPSGMSGTVVNQKATDHENLVISKGEVFQVQGEKDSTTSFDSYLRLCFSYETQKNIVRGVDRLSRVIQRELQDCV